MQIVDDAIAGATTGEQVALRVRATPPLASHPKVIEVLADRVLEVDENRWAAERVIGTGAVGIGLLDALLTTVATVF